MWTPSRRQKSTPGTLPSLRNKRRNEQSKPRHFALATHHPTIPSSRDRKGLDVCARCSNGSAQACPQVFCCLKEQ